MDVLVAALYGASFYHFETDLEIMESHLRNGDAVSALVCNADLFACDVNIDHHVNQCINCIFRRRWSLKKLLLSSVETRCLVELQEEDRKLLTSVRTRFSDLDDLRSYRFLSFDLGMAVLSSIISLTRDPSPCLNREADRVKHLCISSASIYLSVRRLLRQEHFDRVYAYNGRFAPMRAVLRACRDRGVDCFLHDRGSSIDRYALFENSLPHDIPQQEERIRKAWHEARGNPNRDRIAKSFFEDRAGGISHNWISFVRNQDEGRLPSAWNPSNRKVVLFTSSEDEFVAIGDQWLNPLYESQTAGIVKIAESLRNSKAVDCFIRLHPNLRGLSNRSISEVNDIEGDNIHLVPPESPISSYAMLFAADVVLTFGSSMGIEATYWKKPSILAGPSFYRSLGSTHNPASHEELIELLENPLEPADDLGALMYGYYFATFGEQFVHFRPESLIGGEFHGNRVGPGRLGYRLILALRSPFGALPRWILDRALKARADRKTGSVRVQER